MIGHYTITYRAVNFSNFLGVPLLSCYESCWAPVGGLGNCHLHIIACVSISGLCMHSRAYELEGSLKSPFSKPVYAHMNITSYVNNVTCKQYNATRLGD